MKNIKAALAAINKSAIEKKAVFTFKTRPEIAPKGLQRATYQSTTNESSDGPNGVNYAITVIRLEATDKKGNPFDLVKRYNLNGQGAAKFLEDYNSWKEGNLTVDDLYEEFDGNKDAGKPLVVKVGHRQIGTAWEAYIKSLHPVGYTEEPTIEDEVQETAAQ